MGYGTETILQAEERLSREQKDIIFSSMRSMLRGFTKNHVMTLQHYPSILLR
jgi:hypothetical protein